MTASTATPPSSTAPTTAVAPAHPATPTAGSPELPERLGVLSWDVGPEGIGHDPRSAYVETFWLPLLGPSTVLLMRRFAIELERAPDGFEIATETLSREIGLGSRLTRRSPFARTLDRCAKFHLVLVEGTVVHVRRTLPSLSPRQISKLSPRLRALHDAWAIEVADDGPARRAELMRVAHLARTLLALGESPQDAERQLDRWGFTPAMAWHGVHWAQAGGLDALDGRGEACAED